MGQPGDTFEAFGANFELLHVSVVPLVEVAELWKEEGCSSRDDFIAVWNQIHPVAGYRDDWYVYLHHFRRLEKPTP